jgi:hypothetical protein
MPCSDVQHHHRRTLQNLEEPPQLSHLKTQNCKSKAGRALKLKRKLELGLELLFVALTARLQPQNLSCDENRNQESAVPNWREGKRYGKGKVILKLTPYVQFNFKVP